MPIKLSLLFLGLTSIFYLLTIVLKKFAIKWVDMMKKELKITDVTNSKIHSIYFLLLLSVILTVIIIKIIIKPTIFVNYQLIRTIAIGIIFFILGLFFAEYKNIISFIINNYLNVNKSAFLTAMFVLLVEINRYSLSIFLGFSILFIVFLIDYFLYFKKQMKEMGNATFILKFIWFLIVSFFIIFMMIYNIWHL